MSFNKLKLSQLKQLKQQLKLHWLDLIVIIVIIAVAAVLLWQRAQRKTEWLRVQIKVSQEEWWWRADDPEPWYVVDEGAVGFNSFGQKVAEIEKVQVVDTGEGRNQVVIWANLKVSYDPKKEQFIFGFQPLQIGKALDLDLGKQQLKGLVVAFGQERIEPIEKTVILRMNSVEKAFVPAYSVGLQAKSNSGEAVATIKKLKILPALELYYSDIRNQLMVVPNPISDSIEATMSLQLYKVGDQYLYVDGTPVKIGSQISIHFPNVVFHNAFVMQILD